MLTISNDEATWHATWSGVQNVKVIPPLLSLHERILTWDIHAIETSVNKELIRHKVSRVERLSGVSLYSLQFNEDILSYSLSLQASGSWMSQSLVFSSYYLQMAAVW